MRQMTQVICLGAFPPPLAMSTSCGCCEWEGIYNTWPCNPSSCQRYVERDLNYVAGKRASEILDDGCGSAIRQQPSRSRFVVETSAGSTVIVSIRSRRSERRVRRAAGQT